MKARLVAFYTKYAPDKLDSVDDLLAKSQGKEEKLFEKLVAKYGPEPSADDEAAPAASAASVGAPASSSSSAVAAAAAGPSKKDRKKEKSSQKEEEEERKRQAADEARALLEKMRKKDPHAVLPAVEAAESSSEEEDDGYGTREWWKARLVRFYKKYAPEKLEDVDKLLDKAKDDPAQLDKLFKMLEKKYGPEPDPSSSEDEDDQEQAEDAAPEEAPPVLPARVLYCPVDGLPAEYSEYSPDTFAAALPWLAAHVPDLVLQTQGGVTVAEYALAKGVQALEIDDSVETLAKQRKRGGEGKKGDGRVIIEAVDRRKKFITVLEGLQHVPGVKLKDAAKLLGKKFASGASVKQAPSGEDVIEIQGDCSYELPDVLVDFFPELKRDKVYVKEEGKARPAFER